jgi:tetratricopeptide (TPR) repeat protein
MRSVFAPDIWRSLESSTAAEDVYVQLGDSTGARHVRGNRIFQLAQLGRWDEALEVADEFLAECDAGKAHFQESLVRGVRASIRLGRNDDAGAGADLGRAIALAREALDPEDLPTALGSAVRLYAELGRIDDAQDLGRQLLTANPRATRPSLDLALVAERIGLSEALVGLAGDVSTLPPIAYFIALRAILEGRIAEAAETLAGEGRLQGAADVRRYAANALLVEGRRDEAEAQAERALAFYRSVGATRFVRELEALLATMSAGAARS